MDEKFIEILGNAGPTGSIVGICLTLLFYLRKQESGIRSDINGSLARLQAEKETLQAELEEEKSQSEAKESLIDTLRVHRRQAEDLEDKERRRADAAEAALLLARDTIARLTSQLGNMDR